MTIYSTITKPHFSPEDNLILVVDDVNKNLQLIIEILDEAGYSTTFANSGKQAIERVRNASPDLILLDLMMPEMNGLEVCKYLRGQIVYELIPIIFLTASNEKEYLLKAFEYGAVDYITKPFNSKELLARIKTHIDLKNSRDQLQLAYNQLEKLAITDHLTGIFNRRAILTFAEEEFIRCSRYERRFSLLMIDVDFFKSINDNYGHDIGDKVLIEVAETINNGTRKVDILGRFGGEEFVVLLPEAGLPEAVGVAEKIKESVSEIRLPALRDKNEITVSIGVASYEKSDHQLEEIIKRADRSLYYAKNQGRNRVVTSEMLPK
ncbi:MAG: Response regulator PleD [Chroococcopsis gigantea SAG 12.99]|jgi:diguanylate cyclase (GGDEF)-like protein|nr:diguanylate cyclase [Chlorogloea purpurea SAG 13.99]MDV3000735.1 Response regulator PleD [Chroococcopsis gigantea SAG 12.99]